MKSRKRGFFLMEGGHHAKLEKRYRARIARTVIDAPFPVIWRCLYTAVLMCPRDILRVLPAIAVGIFASCAMGSPITYAFTVNGGPTGPLADVITNGEFSYDSSIVVPGGAGVATGLLSAVNFTWNGTHYDSSTANTGVILFNSTGDLLLALFGTNCFAGECSAQQGTDEWFFSAAPATTSSFVYSLPQQPVFNVVAALTGPIITVPEPASVALLAVGLAGVSFSRRKQ